MVRCRRRQAHSEPPASTSRTVPSRPSCSTAALRAAVNAVATLCRTVSGVQEGSRQTLHLQPHPPAEVLLPQRLVGRRLQSQTCNAAPCEHALNGR